VKAVTEVFEWRLLEGSDQRHAMKFTSLGFATVGRAFLPVDETQEAR
jgi:hypothetical protein